MASNPASNLSPGTIRFGPFELDVRSGELCKGGTKIRLPDQPFQILVVLLQRPGDVVSREEIRGRLWPGSTVVEFDHSINAAVKRLRGALRESADKPRYIETLPRRGYRFIAPVESNGLAEVPGAVAVEPAPAPVNIVRGRRPWVAGAIAALLVCAITVIGLNLKMPRRDASSGDAPIPAVPLTGNPGYEAFPTFSPEGTRVAYSWERPGQDGAGIYVKLLGPGDPIRLTVNAGDFGPAWSPDGRYIAFLRARDPFHAVIMMIPAVGGSERELAEVVFDTHDSFNYDRRGPAPPLIAWSADNRWLLVADQRAPGEALSVERISVDTGEKRRLTTPSAPGRGDGALALSPNGKTLAFARTVGLFEREIYLLGLSEDLLPKAEPVRLTFDRREIEGLAWTPDGQRLVFSSKRGGRRELWQIRAKPSNNPVRLIASGDDPRGIAISREGHHLVYSHQTLDVNIWRIPLTDKQAGEPKKFISSTRIEHHPSHSPDGNRIAFASDRSGNSEIWVCNADGSSPVQITAFRNAWAGSPRWSPDGRVIAFDGEVAGRWDIYIIGSNGGKPSRLTTSDANEYRPSWSHDGKWIYYCSTRTGQPQIWKMPAAGGAEIQITKLGGSVAFESFDGKDIYYSKGNELWKIPVQGGAEVRVLESLFLNSFAPVKRGLYFLEASQPSDLNPQLKFLDVATHAVTTVAAIPGPVSQEISVSPDERWLFFNKFDQISSELMLIENFR